MATAVMRRPSAIRAQKSYDVNSELIANEENLISNASVIAIHTGNLVHCDIMKTNVKRTPTEEVSTVICFIFSTINRWSMGLDSSPRARPDASLT